MIIKIINETQVDQTESSLHRASLNGSSCSFGMAFLSSQRGESTYLSPSDYISIKLSEQSLSFRVFFLLICTSMWGILVVVIECSKSQAYFYEFSEMKSPIFRLRESDLLRSMGRDGLLLNQKCFLAQLAVNLSYLFFSNRIMRSLGDLPQFSQTSPSNFISPLSMFSIVVLRYYASNGVLPVMSSQRVIPMAQTSTFSSQPPPVNISGALQQRVPVIVSISFLLPRLLIFLLMPKSMSFICRFSRSQRIFQGFISRWQMFLEWMYATVSISCCMMCLTSSGVRSLIQCRLGMVSQSMTRWQIFFRRSRYMVRYLTMLGWSRARICLKLVFRNKICYQSIFIDFTAYTQSVAFRQHFFTNPFEP